MAIGEVSEMDCPDRLGNVEVNIENIRRMCRSWLSELEAKRSNKKTNYIYESGIMLALSEIIWRIEGTISLNWSRDIMRRNDVTILNEGSEPAPEPCDINGGAI